MNISLPILGPLSIGCLLACSPQVYAVPASNTATGLNAAAAERAERAGDSEPAVPTARLGADSALALSPPPGLRLHPAGRDSLPFEPRATEATTSVSAPPLSPTASPSTPAAASARPSTILAPARSGRIPRAAMLRVIHGHADQISACYAEGLRSQPHLEGDVFIRFLIGPRGRVEQAEVYQSTLDARGVEQCITTAFSTWRFPRPRPRGRSVLATYPYHLSTD